MAHNIEAMARVFQQFPDWHIEIKAVMAGGNKVMVRALSTGDPGSGQTIADAKRGSRQGIRVGDEVVNIFRMADGKIAEHWEVLQPLTSLDDVV